MASSAAQPKAIFSTRLGKNNPRDLSYPLPPVIARSDSFRQVTDYASQLRGQFPMQCNQIFHVSSLSDFFDRYDIHLQSPGFLAAVLNHIIQENLANIKNFTYDWSIAHRFELLRLCEPVRVEKIFDTNLIKRYGVIFLTVALQHMRNSLAALSRQQAMAKDAAANHMHHQFSKENKPSGSIVNSPNNGYGKTAFRKKNWSSNSSSSFPGPGYHKLSKNIMGNCISDRQHHNQRGKGLNEVLSHTDPVIIHSAQSISSQRSISTPHALQGTQHPSEQHWNVQMRDYGPDFWASPNERGVYRSLSPETQGSQHEDTNWYNGNGSSNGHHNCGNGHSQMNSFNIMAAHDSHVNSAPYNSMSPIADRKNRSALETFPSNGSSPSQIRGYTSSIQSTDSFSTSWPSNANSKPYETGTIVRSQRRTSHGRQLHGAASKWQNNYKYATILQNNITRRFSSGSDFGRSRVFGQSISYQPDNVVPKEGYPTNQISGSYDLRMVKSRSLSSSNRQGPLMKNHSTYVPFKSISRNITLKSDPDYFCNKHTIGHKRDDVRTIWVTSFQDASSEELTTLFGSCGTIEDIELRDGSAMASRYAFIRFGSSDEARESLKLHGTFFQDKYLSVQVPRKYWTLSSTHDQFKFIPKPNGTNRVDLISGNRPPLPFCWQNIPPCGFINLPPFYKDAQVLGYLSNYAKLSSFQPECILNGQGSNFPNGSLPYETHQSHDRQVFSFDVAAGGSAGNPSFRDTEHNAHGFRVVQNAGTLVQSRNFEINKKFRRNSLSDLNEKHSVRMKFRNGKSSNGFSKSSIADKDTEEKQLRSVTGSIDQSMNIDKDIPVTGGKDQLESDAKVSIPVESETSAEAYDAVDGDTVIEKPPEVNMAKSKPSPSPTRVRSPWLHEPADQHIELAFSEINSIEISLTSAKEDNCLDIDPKASGAGLNDDSKSKDLIISKFHDYSGKRSSLEGDNEVLSTQSDDIPSRIEAISKPHCGDQEVKSLEGNALLENSQVTDNISDVEVVKSPLPKNISTENTNARAPTMKNSLGETSAVRERPPTDEKLNPSETAPNNTKTVSKQHDPGHTDSIHPFARAKKTKKKGKKMKKTVQLWEKDKERGNKVSELKVPEVIATMPLNVSAADSDRTEAPISLGKSVTGSAVKKGDHGLSCGVSVRRFKSNEFELASDKFHLVKSTSRDSISNIVTVTPKPTDKPSQPDEMVSTNVGEETCSETYRIVEATGNKEVHPIPLAHEEKCISIDKHRVVKGSAEESTNRVNPSSPVGKSLNEIGSKTSTVKKKKKKRSSKSKALSTAQLVAHSSKAQDSGSEVIPNPSHDTETMCQKSKAVVDLQKGEHEKGIAGLGLVIVDSKNALSGSTTSLVQRSSIDATGDLCATTPKSHPDKARHGSKTASQISASINLEGDRSKDSIGIDSSIGQANFKEVHQEEKIHNANGKSSDKQQERRQQQDNSAASEAKEDEYEGEKEQRPALQVQRVSYAAAAAAMAVAGEMAKAVKRSALSDHSRAVEETLIRLEKLHEKEMVEKAGGLYGSAPAPAAATATASTFAAQR